MEMLIVINGFLMQSPWLLFFAGAFSACLFAVMLAGTVKLIKIIIGD